MSDPERWNDPETLAFYDRKAEAYSARREPEPHPRLLAFLGHLPPGGHVLDLGCGGGQDSAVMLAEGFEVTPLDGSAGLAAIAERRLGRPVRVMRFEALDQDAAFDAVWANASLLHLPLAGLPDVLARVRRALKPGGLFYASYKAGEGGGRDRLGRFFSYLTRDELDRAYAACGPWAGLEIREGLGGGYDGGAQAWLQVTVVRPA